MLSIPPITNAASPHACTMYPTVVLLALISPPSKSENQSASIRLLAALVPDAPRDAPVPPPARHPHCLPLFREVLAPNPNAAPTPSSHPATISPHLQPRTGMRLHQGRGCRRPHRSRQPHPSPSRVASPTSTQNLSRNAPRQVPSHAMHRRSTSHRSPHHPLSALSSSALHLTNQTRAFKRNGARRTSTRVGPSPRKSGISFSSAGSSCVLHRATTSARHRESHSRPR